MKGWYLYVLLSQQVVLRKGGYKVPFQQHSFFSSLQKEDSMHKIIF